MKVLWLASWYPNPKSPANGDFIQRHAYAASLYNEVYVLNVEPASSRILKQYGQDKLTTEGNLTERILFYRHYSSGLIGRLRSTLKYLKMSLKAIDEYVDTNGYPDIVHVHIPMRAGLVAWFLKKRHGVPFVVSEHWGGIISDNESSFKNQSFFFRYLYKKTIGNADGISAVSAHLADGIKTIEKNKQVEIIPNVVDSTVFYPTEDNPRKFSFVHASGMDSNKNVELILKAFSALHKRYPDLVLHLAGNDSVQLKKIVTLQGLENNVLFHGFLSQPQLAELFRCSSAFILFSGYETFSCVAAEAHACGLPVISSDIPALRELIMDERYGILVPSGDVSALEKAMEFLLTSAKGPDRTVAEETKGKFGLPIVGRQFSEWYQKILNEIED